MTNCIIANIASFRGFAALNVSPVTLLACLIVIPAGFAYAVMSYLLREEAKAEEEEEAGEAEDVVTQSGRGILSTRQWYAERYVPCALEWAEIERIPLLKFAAAAEDEEMGMEMMMMTSCVVCLAPFREDEMLRVLPPCHHAFHAHCIDSWFETHSTCPICRSKVSCPCAVEALENAIPSDACLVIV